MIDVFAGSTDTSVTFDFTSLFALSVEFNGASSKVYQNGTLLGTINPGTNAIKSMVVGADGPAGTHHWVGDICEIFVTNKIPDGWQRRAMDAYLKAKWGTP